MSGHKRFHERPLMAFTTLAIVGAGLLTAPVAALLSSLVASGFSRTSSQSFVASGFPPPRAYPIQRATEGLAVALAKADSRTFGLTTLLGILLLAAGLLVSLAHLGRPLRSPLALTRAGRSRLSNEIVAVSAVLVSALVVLFVPGLPPWASLAPAVLALVFLITLGRVYDLPGQDTWRGAAAWTPLTLGVWVGAVAACAAGASAALAWAAVVADAAVFLKRTVSTGQKARPTGIETTGQKARPTGIETTGQKARPTGWLRLALADVVPAVLLAVGLPVAALTVLALGVLADRLSFYLHASQHTTEAEIERIEALME
jgi:DMSO reductase anchor subunit